MGEAMPMLRLYWNSGGEIFGDELPMNPDLDAAMSLHRFGRLRIFTARRGGLLIGLNSFNVGTTLYRKTTMTAIALILYMLPSERSGLLGYKFLRETDKWLAEMGVKLVQYIPGSTVDIAPLLLRMGYKRQQGVFEKMLGNQNGTGKESQAGELEAKHQTENAFRQDAKNGQDEDQISVRQEAG